MAKEKSTTELKDELNQLNTRAAEITSKAKAESRMPNEAENNEINGIVTRMGEIRVAIAHNDAVNAQSGEQHATPKTKYSIRKALLEMVDKSGYSEQTQRANAIARKSFEDAGLNVSGSGVYIPVSARSAFTATGDPGTGSDLIGTEFMNILEPLYDRMVLTQAGAQMLTGLRSNIDIPAYGGGQTNWAAENDPAQDGGGTFTHKTMMPKRLTGYIDISRQFLIQDTLAADKVIENDLLTTIAVNVQRAVLDGHAHSNIKPDSLFTGFAEAATDLSWDGIVDMETAVDLDNALLGNVNYIMHTSLYGKAKKTVKKTQGAVGFVLDPDGSLNGYKAQRTNSIVGDADNGYGIVFGNWSDLLIGQWGGIEMIVDPYTKATEGFIRIVVNSYWDVCPRRDASFKMALMK